jgi:hypothetical protein
MIQGFRTALPPLPSMKHKSIKIQEQYNNMTYNLCVVFVQMTMIIKFHDPKSPPEISGTVFFLMMKRTMWVANSTVYISTVLASSVTHTAPVLK